MFKFPKWSTVENLVDSQLIRTEFTLCLIDYLNSSDTWGSEYL